MDVGELQAVIDERYARLDLPSWPDPHPDLASPAEEEYSRVSDPTRYRVVVHRAWLWVEVIAGLDGVTSEALTSRELEGCDEEGRHVRGARLVSTRAGTLTLLVIEHATPSGPGEPPMPGVRVAVGRATSVVASVPACGCDACDDGSQTLLDEVDAAFARVLQGPYVSVTGRGWNAEWHPTGMSYGSEAGADEPPGLDDLFERLREGREVALPEGATAVVSRGWIDGMSSEVSRLRP